MTHLVEITSASKTLFSVAPDPVREKLRSFAGLDAGWHFGDGAPISRQTIDKADTLLSIGMQLGWQAAVFPGIDDNVAVAFSRGGWNLEFIVDKTGSIEAFEEQGTGLGAAIVTSDLPVTLDDVFGMLTKRGSDEWASSIPVQFIDFIFNGTNDAYQTLPSRHLLASTPELLITRAAYR